MQAVVISAYKDTKYLQRLINFFQKEFKVIIHIDKKSNININDLKFNSNVSIYKRYKINWGSYNHLLAILFCLRKVIENPKIKYIHIISGGDIPVKNIKEFKKFETSKLIFMEHFKVSELNDPNIKKRYEYGTRFSNFDSRKKAIKIVNKFYQMTHKPKKEIGRFNESQLYKGLIWMSLPKDALKYVLEYSEKNKVLDSLKNVLIPEEFYFQTILMNSNYRKNVASNNITYNYWSKERHGSLPAILDESDFLQIKNGDYYFARKIDPYISRELVKIISEKINKF